jgi:hypothetical protein
MNKKRKVFLGFIERDKPMTWITAIIIFMLIIPLTVTFILYFSLQ